MTVTWTSGYSEGEARPVVAWKWEDDKDWKTSLASTVTYKKADMCGKLAVVDSLEVLKHYLEVVKLNILLGRFVVTLLELKSSSS